MKTIIHRGVVPPPAPKPRYRATCSRCSTVFEYETEDIGGTYYIGRGFGPRYTQCPLCEVAVRHEVKNLLLMPSPPGPRDEVDVPDELCRPSDGTA